MLTRAQAYQGTRFVFLGVAVLLFARYAPSSLSGLGTHELLTLAGLSVFFTLLLGLGVPVLAFTHFGQRDGDPGRLNFDVALFALAFTLYGPLLTSTLCIIAYILTPGANGRYRFWERLLGGVMRTPLLFASAWIFAPLIPQAQAYSWAGFGIFFALNLMWIAAYVLVVFDPLTSLRTGMGISHLWRLHLRDGVLWSLIAVQLAWGYVTMQLLLRDGTIFALLSLLPLLCFAIGFRFLHRYRLAVHRLTLARDAVQALLSARDPLPHIHSILSSVHSELLKETLHILIPSGPGRDAWHTVASVGPLPDDAALQVRRHAIRELIATERTYSTARSREYVVTAFAARDERDQLLGIMAVHRPSGVTQPLQRRQFEAAAAALGPLLRDFRAIAATQNAAAVDPLTRLANRRTILETLALVMSDSTMHAPCSIIIIDLDHFKTVNDQLGHQAGDRCLQMVGTVVAGNIRGFDRAGRMGGEEFLVIMPEAARDVAATIGERLRSAIERSGFCYADGTPVTASIGVATATLADTPESLIERADKALYAAKRYGRNRVVEMPA